MLLSLTIKHPPGVLAELQNRLDTLGVSINSPTDGQKVALCLAGWVLIVDDRDGSRKVFAFPKDILAKIALA